MANDNTVARMPGHDGRQVPVREAGAMGSLRNEINQLFDRFAGRRTPYRDGRRSSDPWAPRVGLLGRDPVELFDGAFGDSVAFGQSDLSETDDGYELEVDLPGLTRDDVGVDYENGVVTVAAERRDEHEDKRKGYYLSERRYGSFRRSFRVPDGGDPDRIGARFADGVLRVTLPRSQDARRDARRIEVNSG